MGKITNEQHLFYMNDKPRYFRHFKGGMYQYLAEGYDSETQEEVVIYKALYGEGKIWVRPKAMFFETIVRDGIERKRFEEVDGAGGEV